MIDVNICENTVESASCYIQIRLDTDKKQNYITANMDTGATRSVITLDLYKKYFPH